MFAEKIFILNSDCLLHMRKKVWLLSNPRVRKHVELDHEAIAIIGKYGKGASKTTWEMALKNAKGWDRTVKFFGENGLHSDPTGISNTLGIVKTGYELFTMLVNQFLLIEQDEKDYENFLSPLVSIIDSNHMGTFHQKIGQYLSLNLRIQERWRWWHNQKFSEDGKLVRDGPYKGIQENFINNYFSTLRIKNLKVLDFGCGNGYYSAKLADLGAIVTGLDTSKELIKLAKKNFSNKCNFIHVSSHIEGLAFLSKMSVNSFDLIFMQDTFLLLLNPEDNIKLNNISELICLFYRILKDDGRLYAMEPNPIFWLASRFGDPENPFAIITEYKNAVFNVAPLLNDVTKLMGKNGFGLMEYLHPDYMDDLGKDCVNSIYANAFCIWDFMVFGKLRK